MDKTEYGIKLDQINRLVEKQDFQGALEIVETIDWRRVKSIRTLCMVADIYEANGLLEESKEILILAYNRTSAGRAILYRLVEISLKLHHDDDAVEYYTEYCKIARGDNAKYLLKYKIYKARRAPIEEQIVILEDYKSREYTERWAYELARLYDKAGMQDKCIEECDDLILWFSEGKYVLKAMELKMNYTPLSPTQQIRYQEVRTDVEEQEAAAAAERRAAQQRAASEAKKRQEAKPAPAVQEVPDEAAAEAAATAEVVSKPVRQPVETAEKSDYTADQPLRQNSENIQEKVAMSFRDVLSGFSRAKDEAAASVGKAEELEVSQEEEADDIEEYHVVKDLEPEKFQNEPVAYEQKSEDDDVYEPVTVKPEQVNEEQELDLSKILEETANDIARQIGKESTPVKEQEIPPVIIPEVPDEVESITEEPPVSPAAADEPEQAAVEPPQPEDMGATREFDFEAQLTQMLETDVVKPEETNAEEPAPDEAEAQPETPETEEAPEVPEEEELPIEEKILQEESSQERRLRILNDTRPERLTDEQRHLFSYFSRVPGMDQQLLEAMYGVYAYAGDRTSKRGNIAVMGGRGTGKTKLSNSLIKAICKDLGLEAVKFARLDGDKLNEKDPAKVTAKLAGGFLLIERAGAMTAETVDKLSRAMEFRTDSMVVIIEDEKSSMRALLEEYKDFAKKFETVISIPVFTNDELVTFARTYAKEMNYKIDEMGVLALYTLIGEEQTEQEPIIINHVKEIVDNAIKKAQKGTRRFGRKLSARGTDEEGRTILYEKDFDL